MDGAMWFLTEEGFHLHLEVQSESSPGPGPGACGADDPLAGLPFQPLWFLLEGLFLICERSSQYNR